MLTLYKELFSLGQNNLIQKATEIIAKIFLGLNELWIRLLLRWKSDAWGTLLALVREKTDNSPCSFCREKEYMLPFTSLCLRGNKCFSFSQLHSSDWHNGLQAILCWNFPTFVSSIANRLSWQLPRKITLYKYCRSKNQAVCTSTNFPYIP